MIDRDRLGKLLERERSSYRERHPHSRAAYQAAAASLLGSVPMTWMNLAAGGFPVALAEARGARLTDLDGHEYLDLCLGDTAAMAGHSPEPVVQPPGPAESVWVSSLISSTPWRRVSSRTPAR